MNKHIRSTNSRPGNSFSALTPFRARYSFSVFKLSLAFFLLALTLGSCTKSVCPADSDGTFPNTVTITDKDTNPANYHDAFYSASRKPQYPVSFSSTGPVGFAGVDVIVSREGTSYKVQIATGSECPVSINLTTSPRSGEGIGLYQLLPNDGGENLYIQNVPTREAWKCSGGTVNVNTLKANRVAGTFTLNLSCAAGVKTVTGTFDANEPLVKL